MRWDDIPQIISIAQNSPPSPWLGRDFLAVFRSNETIGYVVESFRRIIGFGLCKITLRPGFVGGPSQSLHDMGSWLIGARTSASWDITLFGLGLLSNGPWLEVEILVLETIEHDLRRPGDCIRIPVPETDLPAQQLLKAAGFRATRILEEYHPDGNAYLMERNNSEVFMTLKGSRPRLSPQAGERTVGETVRLRA